MTPKPPPQPWWYDKSKATHKDLNALANDPKAPQHLRTWARQELKEQKRCKRLVSKERAHIQHFDRVVKAAHQEGRKVRIILDSLAGIPEDAKVPKAPDVPLVNSYLAEVRMDAFIAPNRNPVYTGIFPDTKPMINGASGLFPKPKATGESLGAEK